MRHLSPARRGCQTAPVFVRIPASGVRWYSRAMQDARVFPLPFEYLKLGGSIPYDVWNEHGLLLLAKDQPITTEQQLDFLLEQRCLVTLEDASWPVDSSRELGAMPDEFDAASLWPALHANLNQLLLSREARPDFLANLDRVCLTAMQLLDNQRDQSLFMLVQMLINGDHGYTAANALGAAAICHILGPEAQVTGPAAASLFRAALTMNIGMRELQETLARRKSPPTSTERLLIANHADTSEAMLQAIGVEDGVWLGIVRHHHAPPESDAAAQLLKLADVYVARISPRASRPGLSPQRAMRDLYQELSRSTPALAAALVRRLGIYPPGSFVRLANGEQAVVVAVGIQANQPLVVAVADAGGMALSKPMLRDSREPQLQIREALLPGDVAVNLDLRRILRYC